MNRNRASVISVRLEMDLLLMVIKSRADESTEIRDLIQNSNFNWSEFTQLILAQGILPFVYERLNTMGIPEIPAEVKKDWKDLYRANVLRNIIQFRQLTWIFESVSGRGIEMIPLKGIVLGVQAYKNPDLRRCGDIDILIRKEDLRDVIGLLSDHGFSPHIPFVNRPGPRFIHLIKGSDTFSRTNCIDIDVHWRISDALSRYSMDREFFRNRTAITLFNNEISCLSLEDTLVFLSVHGAKHLWHEIRWIVDIIQMIANNPSIDIPHAISIAESQGCRRLVFIALHLAEMMGGIGFGPEIQELLNDDSRSRGIAVFFYDHIRGEKIPGPFSQISALIRSQEQFSNCIRYAAYGLFFFIPSGRNTVILPRSLHPLLLLSHGEASARNMTR